MVFTLRHRRHVGGRKQKIIFSVAPFVHPPAIIEQCSLVLLSVSLEIGYKPSIGYSFVGLFGPLIHFVRSLACSFVRSFVRSSVHSSVCSFLRSSIHSFSIHSSKCIDGFHLTSQQPCWCTEQWRKKSFGNLTLFLCKT